MNAWQQADTTDPDAVFAQIECNLEAMLLKYDEQVDSFSWSDHRSVFWHLTVQVGQVLRYGVENDCEPNKLENLEVLHWDMLRTYNERFTD